MSAHAQAELAPLAALGVLDGDDLREFQAHVPSCPACQAEVTAHEAVAARLPACIDPVAPDPRVRDLVLEPVTRARHARSGTPSRPAWLGLAAVLVVIVLGALLAQRQRQAVAAGRKLQELEARIRGAEAMLDALQQAAAEDKALRDLLGHPGARVTALAGLPVAPLAHGRMVWKAETREAVLLTLGLAPAPPGNGYAVWVIGSGAPVPAGRFQVDAEGRAVVRLRVVDETAQARTFAVTLEPTVEGPAPTGPMVLAGAVS